MGKKEIARPNPFKLRAPEEAGQARKPLVHVYGDHVVCRTDKLGQESPRGRSLLEIVLDASEGFIPLWQRGSVLRWRFQERSIARLEDGEAAKAGIRSLLAEALLEWGDAAPVKFSERPDGTDFEIAVRAGNDCDVNGCVLAMAFFPDAGRHELVIYPKMFEQDHKEQVETLVHELGHVFGLRHFFALVREKAFPARVFGAHEPFTIMNYGAQSVLTDADRTDLKALYEAVWNGELKEINGTPIKLVKPFSAT